LCEGKKKGIEIEIDFSYLYEKISTIEKKDSSHGVITI